MDVRKLKIQFTKGGSGSISTKISLPKVWIDQIGITESSKEVTVFFDESEGRIILKKMNENEVILSREEKKAEYMEVIRREVNKEKGLMLHEDDQENGFQYIVEGLENKGIEITVEKEKEIKNVLAGNIEPDYQIAKLLYKYILEQNEQGEQEFQIYNVYLKKEIYSEKAAEVQQEYFRYFEKMAIDPFGKDRELNLCKYHEKLNQIKQDILFTLDTLPELEQAAKEIKKIRKILQQEEKNGI